jgi:hypothetical protein
MTTGHVLVRGPVESDPLQHKRHQVTDCLGEGWGAWIEGRGRRRGDLLARHIKA